MMNEFFVKIINTENVTHDVKKIRVAKPAGYSFIPGQATDVSINLPGLKDEKRPFTFTCLNDDPYLEFIIKIYRDHEGITKKIGTLRQGDELVIGDAWGAITYKGPGVFIAGGAGITPFISIFRFLYKNNSLGENMLIFSNKTSKDIILHEELHKILKTNFLNTLTREKRNEFLNGRIDDNFLKRTIKNFYQHFYICGPDIFVTNIKSFLEELGAKTESVIIEM